MSIGRRCRTSSTRVNGMGFTKCWMLGDFDGHGVPPLYALMMGYLPFESRVIPSHIGVRKAAGTYLGLSCWACDNKGSSRQASEPKGGLTLMQYKVWPQGPEEEDLIMHIIIGSNEYHRDIEEDHVKPKPILTSTCLVLVKMATNESYARPMRVSFPTQ
ncbi:hypothetical protein VNO77_27598 [Canavalia gladiata]|uniref:Uncharacterized protein n=1 Tax=Canavalia gladiata TaxID=3824 RepID=A0AAN9Q776_CANGL